MAKATTNTTSKGTCFIDGRKTTVRPVRTIIGTTVKVCNDGTCTDTRR